MYTYIIICYIWIYNTYIHVNTSSGTCIPVKSWGWDIHQMVRAEVNTRSSSLGGVYQFNESTLWFWTLPLFPILLEAHSWNMKKTEATNEICMSHQRYQCNKFRQIQGPYPQGWEEIIVDQLTLSGRVFLGVTHGCTINNKQTKNKSCKTFPTCNPQKFTTDDNNQPGHPKCLAISRMPWLLRSTVRKV